jgi:flagellar protein FliO/FliZ
VDTVAVAGRMLVSLAVVLGFMWLIARKMKKPGRAGNSGLVEVLGRRQLSRTASVAVVRVLDQALVLGITDGQVSLIGETDLAAAEEATARPAVERRSPRPRPAATPQPSPRIAADGRILPVPGPAAALPAPVPARPRMGRPPAARPAGRRPALARPAAGGSALSGSALSPDTWRQTVRSLRSLTRRR